MLARPALAAGARRAHGLREREGASDSAARSSQSKLFLRRRTLRKRCGFGASDRVRGRWLRSAAQTPTERLVCGDRGGSFTLSARTGIELSVCSRALCFGRLWHSSVGRVVQRGCLERRCRRAIGDAILFRCHRDLPTFHYEKSLSASACVSRASVLCVRGRVTLCTIHVAPYPTV